VHNPGLTLGWWDGWATPRTLEDRWAAAPALPPCSTWAERFSGLQLCSCGNYLHIYACIYIYHNTILFMYMYTIYILMILFLIHDMSFCVHIKHTVRYQYHCMFDLAGMQKPYCIETLDQPQGQQMIIGSWGTVFSYLKVKDHSD